MSKMTVLSLIVIAAGLLLLGFQSLQALMQLEITWQEITIEGLMKPEQVEWFQSLSWSFPRKAATYILAAPLYALFLVSGGVLLIASGIFGKAR